MKWSFRVATVAGIEVRLHATFVLLLGIYAWMAYVTGPPGRGWESAQAVIVLMLALFLCVLLHEFGHAFAARAFGIRTPDITLLPIGGIARLEKIPSSPWQEFVIAVSGPAVNVVIALLLLPAASGITSWDALFHIQPESGGLAVNLLKLNVILIAFNMIPAFPMDGGRVLRALLSAWMRNSLATLVAARVGQVLAAGFVILGLTVTGNPMLLVIGFFIFLGAQQELLFARMREAARHHRVGDLMITKYDTLPDGLALANVPDLVLGSNQGVFPIVGEDLAFRGLADREALVAASRERPEAPVAELARPTETVHPDTLLDQALETMQKSQQPLLPVVNAAGQLVGLIDIDQLIELSRGSATEPTL